MSSFIHALATNNYGPYKFIVSSSTANGTHTTIASALAAASPGDTVFVRPGSYSEDITIPLGVDLVGTPGNVEDLPVSILGKVSFSAAASSNLVNLELFAFTDYALSFTGSSASELSLTNCNITSNGNTAINYTNSNASSLLIFQDCFLLALTNNSFFDLNGAGAVYFNKCFSDNPLSATLTASPIRSTTQAYFNYCSFKFPLSTANTSIVKGVFNEFACGSLNTTCFTHASTNATPSELKQCVWESGSSVAVSISSGATLTLIGNHTFTTSNANTVSGAGALNYNQLSWNSASTVASSVTTTTRYSSTSNKLPTVQTFSSGTAATYTTPAGAQTLRIRLVGGGGGGSGSGTTPGAATNGGATTFSGGTLSAGGGGLAGTSGGAGGTPSGGNILNSTGSLGNTVQVQLANNFGGDGGSSIWGGNGQGGGPGPTAGTAAKANSGSGGGGAGAAGTPFPGGGGGSGAYVEHLIMGPAASYTYTVGAAGTGGTAGTGGAVGGNGGAGFLIVEEYYNT